MDLHVVRRVLLMAVFAAVVPGCSRTAVLYDPPMMSLSHAQGMDVRTAIEAAMVKLRWTPTEEGPGVIRGTLNLRSHVAVIRVDYTPDSYKISYVSSEDLNYSVSASGTRTIHKNYNSWINNLMREINTRLLTPAGAPPPSK